MESDDSTLIARSNFDEEKLLQVQVIIRDDVEKSKIEAERDSALAISIEQAISGQLPFDSWECSIYRVPRRQFLINPIAYTPQLISIGPFHHGKEHLMAMERHKLLVLDIYLRRINMNVEAAIAIARKWETKARGCYAEPINMSQDEFVKMMLVDGCFLLQFMMLVFYGFSLPPDISLTLDSSFYEAMEIHLCLDVIMLENQLPLFVLEGLFNQLPACYDALNSIITFGILIKRFIEIEYVRRESDEHEEWSINTNNTNHLVHLLSDYYKNPSVRCNEVVGKTKNFLCSIFSLFSRQNNENIIEQREFLLPPTLTELSEAGVIIKKAARKKHSMDISFKDGVLEIPYFEIEDNFESRVRNVMAFEQYNLTSNRYVTNSVAFLDGLISTEKDVCLLVEAEILTNNIGGSHKEVSKLFNDLCKGITLPGSEYYYYDTTKALKKYCKEPKHRWMGSLRRDYFNTPWAFISFLAATFLILLTLLQTIYSLLSYYK